MILEHFHVTRNGFLRPIELLSWNVEGGSSVVVDMDIVDKNIELLGDNLLNTANVSLWPDRSIDFGVL